MTKKERRRKELREMTINAKEIAIKRGRQAARVSQIHKDKNKYDRKKEKQIPNE